jgi:hypothetical protein
MQLAANLVKTAMHMTCCVEGHDLSVSLDTGSKVLTWGFGMFITNLLCHRYLLEKASVMINQM